MSLHEGSVGWCRLPTPHDTAERTATAIERAAAIAVRERKATDLVEGAKRERDSTMERPRPWLDVSSVGRWTNGASDVPERGVIGRGRGAPEKPLEELVDALVDAVLGEGDVLEPAAERVVVTDGGVVDAERGVEGRGDVLGPDVSILAPAGFDQVRSLLVGLADHPASA